MSTFQYQGAWYEIARYPNAGEEGARGKCTVAEYTVFGDSGKVRNTHVVDGVQSYIDGDLTLVGPARVRLTYTFGGNKYMNIFVFISISCVKFHINFFTKLFRMLSKVCVNNGSYFKIDIWIEFP